LHESLRLRDGSSDDPFGKNWGLSRDILNVFLIIKSRHSQCNLRDKLFQQQVWFHHRTVAKAAKSAGWDGLTFDIKGEIIILLSISQQA
jgi:hypothetical protein